MSEEKQDFRQWQANQSFYNDEETKNLVNEYSKKLYVLTFNLDKKGTNIVSQINGCIVFVDRDFQYEVAIGDTWVCKVTPANNCSYATPLIKITLNEVLNFNEKLRENVLNTIWSKYSSDLKVIFENRYKTELQNKIAEELQADLNEKLARTLKEKDEIENELRQTRFQLETQRTNIPAAEEDFILLSSNDTRTKTVPSETNVSDEIVLSSSESEEMQPIGVNTSPQPALGIPRSSIPQIKRAEPVPQKFEVERIGPDTLRSPSFNDNRYFVHISPDYKLLVIRPNEEGNVYCLNKMIRLKDLGMVSGFTDKKFLVAEYSELYEGMLVRL